MRNHKGIWRAALLLAVASSLTLPAQAHTADGSLPALEQRIDEVVQTRPDELGDLLVGLLAEWAAYDDTEQSLFSELGKRDQAQAVITAIERHEAAQGRAETGLDPMTKAVLWTALTIVEPSDSLHDGTVDHPLLTGTDYARLRHQLGARPLGPGGMGDTFRDALRTLWIDYNGRSDLTGMIGEEAPTEFELWLFDVRYHTPLCQPDEVIAWSADGPPDRDGSAVSVCIASAQGDQFHTISLRAGEPEAISYSFTTDGNDPRSLIRIMPDGIRGRRLDVAFGGDPTPTLDNDPTGDFQLYWGHTLSYKQSVSFSAWQAEDAWEIEPKVDQLHVLDEVLRRPRTAELPLSIAQRDLNAVNSCPAPSRPAWVCRVPDTNNVAALCVSGQGASSQVHFHRGDPTLFELGLDADALGTPRLATEGMSFWTNAGLVTELNAGPNRITLMASDGPTGTNAAVGSEFNGDLRGGMDCNQVVDRVAEEFGDQLTCPDVFEPDLCPWAEILPHSDTRKVMLHELRGFSEEQLQLALEEILARRGQISEHPLTTSRSWYQPIGDVSTERLSPIERDNFGMILEQIQLPRPEDAAQWTLRSASGQWRAKVEFEDGGEGTIYGSDHRLRIEREGQAIVLYLPRGAAGSAIADGWQKVFSFTTGESLGVADTADRYPWFLPIDTLKRLNVTAQRARDRSLAGETSQCHALDGSLPFLPDTPDVTLNGTFCTTRDGIPLYVSLTGRDQLEGQDELIVWQFGYRVQSLERGPQPESLFEPPSEVETWVAPG